MHVHYQVEGEAHSYTLQAEDDLREICREIEAHVRAAHPAVGSNPGLSIRIADGVLNGLADNSEELTLDELAG